MNDTSNDPAREAAPNWLRLWRRIPDVAFRVLGLALFLAIFGHRFADYFERGFWQAGHRFETATGRIIWLPYARVLVDTTYLLIALAFVFRTRPLRRAERSREIVLPMIAAFWPFLPFAVEALAAAGHASWLPAYQAFMFQELIPTPRFLAGFMLILVGNALDVWGYAVLFRSLSIVAEARALKVAGPYRLVRHPIYFGQMLAQAGVWLFFANTGLVWIAFYVCFVVMQLYRSRIEDEVLERAFGDDYRAWKRRTFWFV